MVKQSCAEYDQEKINTKRMKVGILTLHSGANFGGTLQCYALYNVLKSMDLDVEVIDYRPQLQNSLFTRLLYNITSARSFSDLVIFFKSGISGTNNRKVTPASVKTFDKFRAENIVLSERVNENSISNIIDNYDVIIVGSDQVWGGYRAPKLVYFGEFGKKYNGILMSYAACAISLKYPYIRGAKLKKLLKRFNAKSVRDSFAQNIVKRLSGDTAQVVLDPTLLYNFDKFVSTPIYDEPYILVYQLGEDIKSGSVEAVEQIKRERNINKVVCVTNYDKDFPYADIIVRDATPQDWVSLIANSAFVFTDSFHSIIFSLKYRKDFIAYYTEQSRASRLIELRDKLHLKRNIITSMQNVDITESIDFDAVMAILNANIEDSFTFLKSNIFKMSDC